MTMGSGGLAGKKGKAALAGVFWGRLTRRALPGTVDATLVLSFLMGHCYGRVGWVRDAALWFADLQWTT